MKPFVLITAAVLAATPVHAFWGKYGSAAEAYAACDRHMQKMGFWYDNNAYKGEPARRRVGWCQQERETRQFLFYGYPGVKNGSRMGGAGPNPSSKAPTQQKVLKRFRY